MFGKPNEELFGRDVYSTNAKGSFAWLAQSQRHRTEYHHINDGWQLGAPIGYFIPPIIKGTSKESDWLTDMNSVAEYDFPQGQIIDVAQCGKATNLYEKTRERMCGFAQLEIVLHENELIQNYARYYPEYAAWAEPECSKKPCIKGGCPLGAANYLTRKI